MTQFLLAALASLAAAAVLTVTIPAEAASVDWQWPSVELDAR
ncbi:hypothetical protein [Variovorax rhizosphaerae]|uniref:Uncharacterized protein n=1 Tax=Variovorax rhizosphaerae TaxID=1836200 RepID=A0ABU8WU24_9BURK